MEESPEYISKIQNSIQNCVGGKEIFETDNIYIYINAERLSGIIHKKLATVVAPGRGARSSERLHCITFCSYLFLILQIYYLFLKHEKNHCLKNTLRKVEH